MHYLQNITLLQKLHEIQKEKRDKTIHSQKKNVLSDQSDQAGEDPDTNSANQMAGHDLMKSVSTFTLIYEK